jgi:YgiT-type zinc finger domain-containing protein
MLSSTCPLCRSKRLRRCVEDYSTRRKGRTLVVPKLELYRCENCGEAFLTDQAMQIIENYATSRRRRVA